MILIVGTCMGFNMILKFVLSLFYVLHLNTSLRLAYYKHVKKTIPIRFIAYLFFKTLHVQVLAYLGNYSPTCDVAV